MNCKIGLRRIRVFRIGEDHRAGDLEQFDRFPDRADRQVGRADVGGDLCQFRIVLRRVVSRDAICDDRQFAGEEGAVVVDVEPPFGARNEGLVKLHGILDRLQSLRAVDRDDALLVDHLAAMAPQQPMGIVVAVAHAMAVSEADRMAGLLQCLAEFEELGRRLGEFGEARCLHPAIAIDDGVADRRQWQADELPVAHDVVLRTVIPAAIFVAEIAGQIAHIEQLVGILLGIVEPHEHKIGARADIGRDCRLGADIFPAFLVDPNLNARRVSEFLGIGEPLLLVALDEWRPAQQAQCRAVLRLVFQFLSLHPAG